MFRKFLGVTIFACAVAWASANQGELVFSGVLALGDDTRFGLVNADGSRSGWHPLGSVFEGHTLKSYDAASKTLTLEKDGQVFELSLASSKLTGDAEKTAATLADAQAVFERMQFARMVRASMEKSFQAQNKMMAQNLERQGGGKIDPEALAVFQQKVAETMIEAMQLDKLEQEMAQVYADTFSKDELQAMAAFYATPAGTAMIEKQPQIQAKMQEMIMPRMMQAMPKVKALADATLKDIKAKAATPTATPATP